VCSTGKPRVVGGEDTMEVRWGIVGLGQLAYQWIGPAIKASKSGRLVACAGVNPEGVKEFVSAHGVERGYHSYGELVQDPAVDAVYVSAPNALHHPIVLAAAAAGKHVLCEKPMALTTGEAEEMIVACRTVGVTLLIGLQLRFQLVLQAAARTIREGRIGVVREVTVQRYAPVGVARGWRHDLAVAGAGAMVDVGVHMVDFVQWILDDKIVRVFALAHPSRNSGRPDDTTTLLLEFERGSQATIRCSREMPIGCNDLQVFGTGGMLATGPLRWVDRHRLTVRVPDGCQEHDYPAENLYLREIEMFAEELAGIRTSAATAHDGLRLVQITEALIRSLEAGSAISIES
jgi:1,5-anhydro-D-fructose reductase (1,5-anhydro-D-mannitol-forming)